MHYIQIYRYIVRIITVFKHVCRECEKFSWKYGGRLNNKGCGRGWECNAYSKFSRGHGQEKRRQRQRNDEDMSLVFDLSFGREPHSTPRPFPSSLSSPRLFLSFSFSSRTHTPKRQTILCACSRASPQIWLLHLRELSRSPPQPPELSKAHGHPFGVCPALWILIALPSRPDRETERETLWDRRGVGKVRKTNERAGGKGRRSEAASMPTHTHTYTGTYWHTIVTQRTRTKMATHFSPPSNCR